LIFKIGTLFNIGDKIKYKNQVTSIYLTIESIDYTSKKYMLSNWQSVEFDDMNDFELILN